MDNGSNHPRVLRQCLSIALSFLFVVACSPENPELGDVGLAAEAATTPRDVYGNPDLNGIWQSMGSAHRDVEVHAVREGPIAHGLRVRPVAPWVWRCCLPRRPEGRGAHP